jgi:DNA primase
MRFSKDFLDEIRARVPVSDVVGTRVKLRRQGREFIGLSPFNNERSPSFTVNDKKGFYHCFSSGKHGDVFRFLMDVDGLPFNEAVERLAGMAGLALPAPDPEAEARAEKRTELTDVMRLAAEFFIDRLQQSDGKAAKDYLLGRGLSEETIKRFGLGYAPNSKTALKNFLKQKDVPQSFAEEGGLLIHGEDIPESYDRFRDRISFPIQDARGRVIGFGGRAMGKDAKAKYLNSPETSLFSKGKVLYNHHRARGAAYELGTILVMEGYMDVIAAAQAGIAHAVAPLGTALTEDQLRLLWAMCDQPILCFDGDKAGLRAAFRVVEVALAQLTPGKTLRFALLPEGQDPDDVLKNQGRVAFDEIVGNAKGLFALLWMKETYGKNLEEPEARAALEQAMKTQIATISDAGVRHWYEQALRDELRSAFRPNYQKNNAASSQGQGSSYARGTGFKPKGPPPRTQSLMQSSMTKLRSNLSPRECVLVMTVVNHPELLNNHAEDFAAMQITAPELEDVRQGVFQVLDGVEVGVGSMHEALVGAGFGQTLAQLEQLASRHAANWFMAADTAFNDVQLAWGHMVALHAKRHDLNRELHEAEAAVGRDDATEADFQRLSHIRLEIDSLEGREAEIENFGVLSGRKKS